MTSLSIPSDIASYLTPDEKVLMIRKAKWEIYATNKRLILKKGGLFGKEIIEASYRHISSIEYGRRISLRWIVAGICVAVFGTLGLLITLNFMFGNIVGWLTWYGSDFRDQLQNLFSLPIICGAILILIGVALSLRPPVFTIHIVGRKPIILKGKKLEELIKVVRQYREEIATSEKVS